MSNYSDEAYGHMLRLIEDFFDRLEYKPNYDFELDWEDDRGWSICVLCHRPDVMTGEMGVGRGGKAYLTPGITESQLARLLFGILMDYEEHEAREFFKVDGVSIFGPHIALGALLEAGKHFDYV
jgi:hypothetical protein